MRTVDREGGQVVLEFALLLPFVLLLLLATIEVGMLVADNTKTVAAAREAARVAAVTGDPHEIERAAKTAGLEDLVVATVPRRELRVQGEPVTVTVVYEPRGRLPIIGLASRTIELEAQATMRIEVP